MADTQYRVTIPRDFIADQRVRSGVTVTKQDGYVGPLTDEQLEAIQADEWLTVAELEADKPATAPNAKSSK